MARYDDADLNRAIQAYKFFFPTVSIAATWDGNRRSGLTPSTNGLILLGSPAQTVLTPNSDTPYAGVRSARRAATAATANAQMRVQSFADRRPDRVAWRDRKWEWASLRPENGTFDLPARKDLDAREKWFYQAEIESPAMFRRSAAAGSLYWLGTRDRIGAFLDGMRTYRLRVPRSTGAGRSATSRE
jgi:hypothetical protein